MSHEPARNIIAIVGRPNVGKSSLFNRILGRRVAIVEKHSGTTRDRLGQATEWNGVPFELLDTGGIVSGRGEALEEMVKYQVEIAISEASVLLFLVDVLEGVTPLDIEIAQLLRKSGQKNILLVVNKCDNPSLRDAAAEFYSLGFEKLFGVSALHGLGIGNLLDQAISLLPGEIGEESLAALRLAVVGQPNVGKSTFINFLVGQKRLIVHDAPGTTRDSIDVTYQTSDGERIVLIDTAGIRRRRSMSRPIEKLSSLRAEGSVARCDVALLMLDAAKGPTTADARIGHIIREKEKGCVLVLNKWDLVKGMRQKEFASLVYDKLRFLSYCPMIFTVATKGRGLMKSLDRAREVHRHAMSRVPTPALNDVLEEALRHQPPPLVALRGVGVRRKREGRKEAPRKVSGRLRRKRLKVYYATQTGVAPPRFRLFVNGSQLATPGYLSYLTNRIRASFPFPGSPIVLELRERA
jgi:GTP-binding protein